jgi:hypothetical protein
LPYARLSGRAGNPQNDHPWWVPARPSRSDGCESPWGFHVIKSTEEAIATVNIGQFVSASSKQSVKFSYESSRSPLFSIRNFDARDS